VCGELSMVKNIFQDAKREDNESPSLPENVYNGSKIE
jgi:hypothetical protein